MILNYTKVAIRRLLKNKIYLLINVLGVGIAIASAMTAYLLVAYNIEFDSTVDEGRVKNIVKVVHHRKQADGDPFKQLVAPLPLGPSVARISLALKISPDIVALAVISVITKTDFMRPSYLLIPLL